MTSVSGSLLGCPNCKRRLGALDWLNDNAARCRYCLEDFEVVRFPLLTRTRHVAKPQAVLVADDSTCFFHSDNQAEQVCESCGRFLCSVCSIPAAGGNFCPSCVATATKSTDTAIPNRILYSSIALALAILPLLMWFFTFLTAPIVIWLVISGWKKPGSLVYGRRTYRFVIAGLIALIQLGFWGYMLINLFAVA